MGTESHSRRYVFRPNQVDSLERREVPTASPVQPNLRNFSATVVGSARPTPMDVSRPEEREVDFSATGKDSQGKPVRLTGSLTNFDPTTYSFIAGTLGTVTLSTRKANYHFDLSGPASDLNATSGVTDVHLSARRAGTAAKLRTHSSQILVSVGSLQIQRQAMPDGSEQVTATIIANTPWKVRTRRS